MRTRSEVLRTTVKPPKSEPKVSSRLDTDEVKKKKIAELSTELQHQLHPPPSPFHFPTANPSRKVRLRPDLDQIVEVTYVVNLYKTWEKLHAALKIGEKRSDHGTLQKALDEAETNAHNAHRVYVTAFNEHARWEREMDVIFGAMWSEANRSLQKEKDDGLRSKQITDQDVKMRVSTLFPEEYQIQETRRASIKQTVEVLKDLSEQWKSRCKTLQTMMGKLRG